jgi:hypothetical protein
MVIAIAVDTWMPDEPVPMTATRFPVRSILPATHSGLVTVLTGDCDQLT